MEKVGMTYEKRDYYYGGECVYYAINRDRWHQLNNQRLVDLDSRLRGNDEGIAQ